MEEEIVFFWMAAGLLVSMFGTPGNFLPESVHSLWRSVHTLGLSFEYECDTNMGQSAP